MQFSETFQCKREDLFSFDSSHDEFHSPYFNTAMFSSLRNSEETEFIQLADTKRHSMNREVIHPLRPESRRSYCLFFPCGFTDCHLSLYGEWKIRLLSTCSRRFRDMVTEWRIPPPAYYQSTLPMRDLTTLWSLVTQPKSTKPFVITVPSNGWTYYQGVYRSSRVTRKAKQQVLQLFDMLGPYGNIHNGSCG